MIKKYLLGLFFLSAGIFCVLYPFYLYFVENQSLNISGGFLYQPKTPGIGLVFLGLIFLFAAAAYLLDRSKDTERPAPKYPYDKKRKKIVLSEAVNNDLKDLCAKEGKSAAMIKISDLTGADLYLANNYIDQLIKSK